MGTKSLVFEIIGVDRASASLEKVGAAATATSGKMSKMQRAGQVAGRVAALGFAAVAAGAVIATKAAIDDQASQAQLAKQLANTTGATKEQDAAVESWISHQEVAAGVADDDIRPALAKLATATGDVGTAQRLTALAMNVAAGSGQSLASVTKAIVAAENGRVTGLSKLGIQTKVSTKDTEALKAAQITAKSAQASYTAAVKAHGATSAEASIAADRYHLAQQKVTDAQTKVKSSTISTDDALGQLAEKYRGDAAASTETAAGKARVLGIQFHELEEQIGTALIPVMSQLATILLKVVGFISQHTKAVGIVIGSLIALAAIIKVVTLVTAAYNAVMDANPVMLVVIAVAALTAGLIYAYTHSAKFKAVVDDTFGFIKKYVPPIIAAVVNFVKQHWQLLVTIIGGPLGIVVGLVVKHFTAVKNFITQAIAVVVASAKDVGKFAAAVGQHVADAAQFFAKLPNKITGFLASLPGQLLTIGTNIVMGLVHGIENSASKVLGAVQSLVDKIPKKIRSLLGIASPSKVTTELGMNIGDGLAAGMNARQGAVADAAKKLTDKIKSQLSSLQGKLSSSSSGVFGNLTGSLFSASASDAVTDSNGNVVTPAQTAGQNLVSSLTTTAGSIGGLKAAFKALKKSGWSPSLLAQLFSQGGPDLIMELGSNSGEASAALSALHTINKGYGKLGNMVGQNQYGDQIAADEAKLHGKGKGKDGTPDPSPKVELHFHGVTTDPVGVGREVRKVLLDLKRANGGLALGLA